MNKKIIYFVLVGVFVALIVEGRQMFMPSMFKDVISNVTPEQEYKTPPKKKKVNKAAKAGASADNTTVAIQENVEPDPVVLDTTRQAQGDTIAAIVEKNDSVVSAEEKPIEEEPYMKIVRRLEKTEGWINNFNSASHRGIYGYIRGIYYGNGKIFLLTTLQNTTNVDYEIESIAFISNSIRTTKKQIAPDEIIYTPIWQTDLSVIPRKSSVKAIFVFEKFFIAENKNVLMSIYENEGERNVTLKITPDYFVDMKYIR